MKAVAFALFAFLVATPFDQPSRRGRTVVGTWRLVAASATTAEGRQIATPYGPNPLGLLTYTADGSMAALISHSGRKPLSADRISSPTTERAEAFATFFAYAGSYSIDGQRVIHHVEISSVQNWVDTDLIRTTTFDGGRMTLRTPPLRVGGTLQTTELVWERTR